MDEVAPAERPTSTELEEAYRQALLEWELEPDSRLWDRIVGSGLGWDE